VPAREPPLAVGGDERERVGLGPRHSLGDELRGLRREPPQPALLPRVDEPARRRVVPDRSAGAGEAEPAARALPAALDRPCRRRAAARAERRLDPLEPVSAVGTELPPTRAADDAALRQEQVEHTSTLGGEV
jgi:hypothetical protein